ncbi:MAG: hypothetical protein A3C15_01280 [Candidatus Magasanikbacteria bacterium RIFCSPHIGHO2_02_FULL_50_9b]|uniref:Uncharacterized protein n=1 Tax=Candidatus Magasanikbacteria bacterium RIFCSPHIGHO2_02_FULL_50_9b TaxID=1798682 RepID=A0A1F6M9C8_9BACT|nr:MAG: hypothetical protein A3C15_01280 [Candidatus Magasanikbacteria bacterium RIFCSPHIGHO2_02_FULL_50_9b]
MNQGTHVFVLALVLFATGTSAIGYSLAQESARTAAPINAAFSLIDLSAPPWYCKAVSGGPLKAQGDDEQPGYYDRNRKGGDRTPGYAAPGYVAPPGYTAPSYSAPGYTPPTTPGYEVAVPRTPEPPANNDANGISQKMLSITFPFGMVCPDGYALDTNKIDSTCFAFLKDKLNLNKKIAKSPDVFAACKKVFKPELWDAKISQKVCTKFYAYETDCAKAQSKGKKCVPLATYMTKAGVKKKEVAQASNDAIYWCSDVFPK